MNRVASPPALGFVGAGWIGRNRMEAVARSGAARVQWVADLDLDAARAAATAVGCGTACRSLEDVLDTRPDGVVIATPNALHAEQVLKVVEQGIPVFCQKPLARTAAETAVLVAAARAADVPLGVDLSYRHADAFATARRLIRSRGFGRVYVGELWFHNAFGPDKPWFLDAALAGGGCALDLGTHLIDLALWCVGPLDEVDVRAHLFHRGRPIPDPARTVEDYAAIELDAGDVLVRIACSWYLPAGVDAEIGCTFCSAEQSVDVRNVDGSYFDFVADHRIGRASTRVSSPPDDWGGRALCRWAELVAAGAGFDPEIESAIEVAQILDRVYGRAS